VSDATSQPWGPELRAAVEAVLPAAALCIRVQRDLARAGRLEKGDKSPVTVADFGSQALVGRVLRDRFPDDALVGEEASDALREQPALLAEVVGHLARSVAAPADADEVCAWIDHGAKRQHGARYWTVDPIDGTKGFLRGEQYAVCLALMDGPQVAVGVMACPNLGPGGTLYCAARGQGARALPLDGLSPESLTDALATAPRLQVSHTSDPTQARFAESVEKGHTSQSRSAAVAARLGLEREPLRMDSMGKYARVAQGEVDYYLRLPKAGYTEKVWDHAAGALIVLEAGGRLTDVDGQELTWEGGPAGHELSSGRGLVASNGHLHAALLSALAAELEQ
jgi:3'(2'), 5'-bisphosphate nucleotidase